MKINKNKQSLIIAFVTILFWDLIEKYFPNCQFIILILLLLLNFKQIKKPINNIFLIISLVVFIQGIFNVLLGNNNLLVFIIQYGSIIVSYLAFSCVIEQFGSKTIIEYYWKTSFIMSIFGCLEILFSLINVSFATKLPLLFNNTNFYNRVVGVFPRIAALCNEPSFLGYFLAPAVFLIIYSLINGKHEIITFNNKRRYIQGLCILIVYLMSFSAVAYMGLVFMFVFIWLDKDVSWIKIIFPVLAIGFILILYNKVPDFKMRIDDTYNLFFANKLDSGSINLSSYTYYSNFRVSIESIKSTLGLGTGLGSYRYLFDKYNMGAWGASEIILNREDGNSLLFRIIAELGITGFVAVLFFLVYFLPKTKAEKVYGLALLSMFCMIIIRMGNYTHGGIWLYIVLYIKLWKESKSRFVGV